MAMVLPLLAAIPAGVGTALAVAGTAIGAIGTVQQANAASSTSEYNARVADRDAFVADQNRVQTVNQSRIAADDKRRDNRRVMASMRVQYGASGLSMSGSPLDVLEDTAIEQELDVRRTEFEGRARGREGALQMLGFNESATLDRGKARSARSSGVLGGFGTALSGAGNTLIRTA